LNGSEFTAAAFLFVVAIVFIALMRWVERRDKKG